MKKLLYSLPAVLVLLSFFSFAEAQNAVRSPQQLVINGKSVSPDTYNIDGSNYFKIRDIAYYLDFGISYDDRTSSVMIYPDQSYSGQAPESADTPDISVSPTTQAVYIDGTITTGVDAYNINGSNYFKIRDLAKEIDFGCIYNSRKDRIELSSGFGYNSADIFGRVKDKDKLKLTFIDVGQGDSILIEFPNDNGEMLIDAGTSGCGKKLTEYLSGELPDGKLEYVVATHAHADHIGSMQTVMANFGVDTFYAPKLSYTSKTYLSMMSEPAAINAKTDFKIGQTVDVSPDVSFKFLAPVKDSYKKDALNNSSTVIMLRYRDKAFLFMGDAERDSEYDLIGSGADLKCDLVKIGHHGSYTASYNVFCKRVLPQYAVCMLAADNTYGHPADIVINNWHSAGARVLATSTLGDIVVTSDGKTLSAYPDEDYQTGK